MAGEQELSDRIYRWEGWIFNGVCALYFLILSPVVVDAAGIAARDPEKTVIWLGVLLVLITFAEIYAFPRKMKFVAFATRMHQDEMGRGIFLWMMHTVISIIIVFTAAGAFGTKVDEDNSDMPFWLGLCIFATVMKELYFLMCLWHDADKLPAEKFGRPNRREWILDGILVTYSCLGYSATWGMITANMSLERDNPPMFILNLLLSCFLFLLFYLPLRIPYFMEELARARTKKDYLWIAVSILLVMVPAILILN